MDGFHPEQLTGIFRALEEAGWDAILVGGQAVNIWACHYEYDQPQWVALRPYTSRDLDYHGGLAEARLAMRVLGATGQLNTGADPSPNAGVLKIALADGRELIIDVLTGVYGVSAAEVERTAVAWSGTGELAGMSMRVIHPLLLTEGKSATLRGLPQAERQDAKHLRLLTLVLHQWLLEQLAQPRVVFRAVERLSACAASPDGLHAFGQGIDLLEAIPVAEMRSASGFTKFFDQRFDQLLEKIDQKRERYRDALNEG